MDDPTAYYETAKEIRHLREALFKIQTEQLSRATDESLTAAGHRRYAMATRDRIILILSHANQPQTAGE